MTPLTKHFDRARGKRFADNSVFANSRAAFLALAFVGISSAALADAIPQVQPQRFSIAISGGASKGAYEAGLNWAILQFGAQSAEIDPELGGRGRGFEAASFAGASAGAINSLLSGLTWCLRPEQESGVANNISENFFRDVWLKPDVNRLLPEIATSDIYMADDALLSRRDLIDAARDLRNRWHQPSFRPGCRVPLGVTVTRVEPALLEVGEVGVQNQRFYIPFELRVDDTGRVGFFLDPADYPRLNDSAMILIPTQAGEAPFSITDDQVEAAVMTSAAFPLAFGRKRLTYCRLNRITTDARSVDETNQSLADAASQTCPEGYELAKAVFADGGLFDNLPIGIARVLAESHHTDNAMPVTYVYLDPNRRRFAMPAVKEVCGDADSSAACESMEYSFGSESELLLGALGTARRYELYRELTSPAWQLNLSELLQRFASQVEQSVPDETCERELPYYSTAPTFSTGIRDATRLLELAYDLVATPITDPFSLDKLNAAGIVSDCRKPKQEGLEIHAECEVDIPGYRNQLIAAAIAMAKRFDFYHEEMEQRLRRSGASLRSDRVIRVTSLGMPITGSLLESFGAFLDLKFREYDYYAGVYDAVIAAVDIRCNLQYSADADSERFAICRDRLAESLYRRLVEKDARGRYVFALLARAEFAGNNELRFAYDPMPAEDQDMRLIHEALVIALEAGTLHDKSSEGAFFVEREFFDYLRDNHFTPTPTETGEKPLLTRIMEDPDRWAYELVTRMTNRQILLEQSAQRIIADRNPQRSYDDQEATATIGSMSYILRTATYRHEGFAFSPSVAPKDWGWRNVIPYELGFEAGEGDLTATWQPTYALTSDNLLSVRGTYAFAGGVFRSAADRYDYVSLGFNYTHLVQMPLASSFGFAPIYYHYLSERENRDRTTWGAELHMGLFSNRMRIGLGVRNVDLPEDTVTFTIGVTDIPGMIYWTTR